MRVRRRHLAALIVLAAGACSSAGTDEAVTPAATDRTATSGDPAAGSTGSTGSTAASAVTTTTAVDPAARPPWLIKHGWDIPRPDFVEQNAAAMEQLGFDGVVIQIPSSGEILSQQPIGYEQLRAELAPLGRTRFTTMTHNFVILYSGDLGPYYEDWSTAVTNMGALARAAREVGLQGIVYDNENYEGVTWDWKAEEAPTALREAEEIVMAKGHDVMAAVEEQWPDATLISLIGPWVSHADTAEHFNDRFGYNDVAWANELIGPFFLGMASAVANSELTLVDGGEVYTPRSDRDFQHAYEWLKSGVAEDDDLLPEPVRSGYPEAVSVGFGVFDRPLPNAPMDAEVWRETLTNAMQTADHYVWAYTELHDWWGTGWPNEPVPSEFVEATAATQAQAGR